MNFLIVAKLKALIAAGCLVLGSEAREFPKLVTVQDLAYRPCRDSYPLTKKCQIENAKDDIRRMEKELEHEEKCAKLGEELKELLRKQDGVE